MKKVINKVNNWLLSVYARLLDFGQGTDWWKNYQQKKENKWWEDQKEAALNVFLPVVEEGEQPTSEQKTKYAIAKALIDNEIAYLRVATHASPDSYSKQVNQMVIKACVHAIKELAVLHNIVGVQPLVNPVGLAYHMRYTFEEPVSETTPGPGFNGSNGKMKLEVKSHTIEARTARLQAKWNMEAVQDLKTLHGEDHKTSFEDEIAQVIGTAVAYEIVQEVLSNLVKLGDQTTIEPFDIPKEKQLVHMAGTYMNIEVNRSANEIARLTRRGPGNFLVVSPITLSMIQASSKSVFVSAPKDAAQGNYCTLRFAGTLNASIRVFVSTSLMFEHKVLIGYKGKNGELDTGYLYCPYVLAMTHGPVIDPLTFQPVMGLMTRYGTKAIAPSNLEMSKPSDYYGTVDVTRFQQMFNEWLTSPVSPEEIVKSANNLVDNNTEQSDNSTQG